MTNSKHHVIYLPGIGDDKDYGQRKVLKAWRMYGLDAQFHQIGWADGEAFAPKLKRIIAKIDKYTNHGNKVSLVGVSAGASAAIVVFSRRRNKVTGVVCVCGKIRNPKTVSEELYAENPAFRDSMGLLPQSLKSLGVRELRRILSIHPLLDKEVPTPDTKIARASEKTILTFGHGFSIAFAITFGSITIARFLKRLAGG